MSIEHKPGVMCVVIGGLTDHGRKAIGQTVTLVRFMRFGETHVFEDGRGTCLLSNAGWLVVGDGVSCIEGDEGYAFYKQEHLMPIQDPDQPFKDVRKTVLHITVDKTLKVTEVDFVPNVVKV